jgi:hypothetical protein
MSQSQLPIRQAIRRLVEAGLVRGLDDAALDQLRAECWDGDESQMDDAGVLGVLTSYYQALERGMKDGFFWRDDRFWNQTEDVVAELSELVGPLFRQVGISEKLASREGVLGDVQHLELERDDGALCELEVHSLDDVVHCFNEELAARNAPVRLIELETSGEWRMYVAVDRGVARQLAADGALPVADPQSLV